MSLTNQSREMSSLFSRLTLHSEILGAREYVVNHLNLGSVRRNFQGILKGGIWLQLLGDLSLSLCKRTIVI